MRRDAFFAAPRRLGRLTFAFGYEKAGERAAGVFLRRVVSVRMLFSAAALCAGNGRIYAANAICRFAKRNKFFSYPRRFPRGRAAFAF